MAVVTISLDVDAATGTAKLRGVGQELRKTGQEALSAKGLVSSIFQGLGQGVGIAAVNSFFGTLKSGFGTLAGMVGVAGDFAGELLKVESAIGLTAKQQEVLRQAGEDVGVSFEKQIDAIGKMAKVLDAHPEKLKRIGMSYEDIKNLSPDKQFEEIGKRVASIEDPMRRVAVAQEFFGKGAKELLPLFSGALATARENVDKFGLAMDEKAVRPLDDLADAVGLMGQVWDAWMRNIAGVIAQSQPLQTLVAGVLDLMGRLSKSTKDNTSTFRSFVDAGVVWVAKSMVTLIDVVQLVMDVWDGLRLAGRALYTVVIDLGMSMTRLAIAGSYFTIGGAKMRAELEENMKLLQAEKDAQTTAADAIVSANTKRTNTLGVVRSAVLDLSKAVEAGVGKTYQAAAAEEKHGSGLKVLAGNAEEVSKKIKDTAAALDLWIRKEAEASAAAENARVMKPIIEWIEKEAKASKDAEEQRHKNHERRMKDLDEWMDAEERASRIAERERQRQKEQRVAAMFDGLANVLDLINPKLGRTLDILKNMVFGFMEAKNATDKFYASAAALGQIGALIGGRAGRGLSGAAGGAMSGFALSGGNPIGAVIGGLVGGIAGLFGGGKEKKAQQKAERDEALKSALSALDQLAQRLERFKQETLQSGVAGVNSLMGYLASQTDLSADRMARMGSIGFGVFQMLRNAGMGIVEAMNAMGPAFDAALKKGADGFGAKFAELAAFRQLVLDNADLVTAAESIGDVINAYRVNGMLTQEMFNDIISENRSLVDDMIAQGFTLEQALAVNARSLYAIYKAQKDNGLVVDEVTQKYIDQAEKAGLFEGMKDPMEELVKIQQMMLEIMAELVKVMGGALPDSVQAYIDKLNAIPTSVNTTVNRHYTSTGDPGSGGGGGDESDGGGEGRPEYAMGGISTRPHLAMIHGTPSNPEVVAPVGALIRGIGQAVSEGQGGGVHVGSITVNVPDGTANPEDFGRRVAEAVKEALKKNTSGLRQTARAELG